MCIGWVQLGPGKASVEIEGRGWGGGGGVEG